MIASGVSGEMDMVFQLKSQKIREQREPFFRFVESHQHPSNVLTVTTKTTMSDNEPKATAAGNGGKIDLSKTKFTLEEVKACPGLVNKDNVQRQRSKRGK